MPDTDLPIRGTLRLFSSDEGQLTAPGLAVRPRRTRRISVRTINRQAGNFHGCRESCPLVLGHNPGIQFGQTIDVQMLHIIDEHLGGLNQQVLAVANVSRSAGQNSLPLALPAGIRPLVLVNGHRVRLQETAKGFAIPLPVSSVDCQVLLTWTEPAAATRRDHRRSRIASTVSPRTFRAAMYTSFARKSSTGTSAAPATEFAASDSTDVMHILDRLITHPNHRDDNLRLIPGTSSSQGNSQFHLAMATGNIAGLATANSDRHGTSRNCRLRFM